MFVALLGILATTVFGALEGLPILVLDVLAALFLLAAGIVSPQLSSRAMLALSWGRTDGLRV